MAARPVQPANTYPRAVDIGQRIRLIQQVRNVLEMMVWYDRDLVLDSFGVGHVPRDDGGDTWDLTYWLRDHASDQQLAAMARHLGLPGAGALTEDPVAISVRSPADDPLEIFASHLAAHKTLVGHVADELQVYGITLFVAHVSIEPDRLWAEEIMARLRSCHAALAFLHAGWSASRWCDQEIGWLRGREVPIFLFKFEGQDPYGFIGDRQAFPSDKLVPAALASMVVQLSLGRPELHHTLGNSLVVALGRAGSFNQTDRIWDQLRKLTFLTEEQRAVVRDATARNDQVFKAHSGDGRLYPEVIDEWLQSLPAA